MVIQKSRIIELQRVVVSTYLKWLTCVISLLLSEYNTDAVCIESQSVTWNLQAVQDKQIIYAYNDSATRQRSEMVIQKSRIIELQRVVVSTYLKWLTCVISLLLSEYNTDAVCIESQSVTWNLQAVQDKQIIYAYNDSATSSCYKWQITHSGIALHVLKLQLLDLQLQSNCAGTSLSLHSGHSSSTGILDGGSWTKNSGPVLAMKVTGDKALVALVTCVGVPYRLILTYWNEQKDIKEEKAIESRPLNLALYALTGCIGCSVVIAIVLLIAVRNKAIILRKICASRNRSQKHVILVIPAEKSKTSSNIEEHISILEP